MTCSLSGALEQEAGNNIDAAAIRHGKYLNGVIMVYVS